MASRDLCCATVLHCAQESNRQPMIYYIFTIMYVIIT